MIRLTPLLLTCLLLSACTRKVPEPMAMGSQPVTFLPSWSIGAIGLDPLNAIDAGAADSNPCSPGAPCLTWQQWNAARYGCLGSPIGCPRLRQTAMVEWFSASTGSTDPIYFFPTLENGASAILSGPIGAGQTACSGTLSGFTARAYGTPGSPGNLYSATLCGGAAIGDMIVDTTAGAVFWVYSALGGGSFSFTQPLQGPLTVPRTVFSPTEKVISSGDSYTAYALVSPDIVSVAPIMADLSSAGTSRAYIQHLDVQDPHLVFAPIDPLNLGCATDLVEASSNRVLVTRTSCGAGAQTSLFNSYLPNGIDGQSPAARQSLALIPWAAYGGCLGSHSSSYSITEAYGSFDFDVILSVYSTSDSDINVGGTFGSVYIDSGDVVEILNSAYISGSAVGARLWGPGSFDVFRGANLKYTGTAANAFLVPSFTINGQSTACSMGPVDGGAATTWCGIPLNVANLDTCPASATAFCGTAFAPSGGTITNVGD